MSIKKGDLVMVVKPTPCCGVAGRVGKVFMVSEIRKKGLAVCTGCLSRYESSGLGTGEYGDYIDINRAIKLNPPSDEEKTQQTKELEHTA